MLPEEQELARLNAQQAELEESLSSAELDFESTIAETGHFKRRYYLSVSRLYAELDELEAKIAQARLSLAPNDPGARAQAASSEARAKQSAEEAGLAAREAKPVSEITPELKQAYRRAVKLLHPDLALDENERSRRTNLMAQINLAYEQGDLGAIEKIIRQSGEDPDAIVGEDVGSQIVKAIRRISQLRRRLEELEGELELFKKSEIYILKQTIEDQEANGGDPLDDLARALTTHIAEKQRELADLVGEAVS